MFLFYFFCILSVSKLVFSDFTFRNVVVTCDVENPSEDEVSMGITITANRLKPHLPEQKCYMISILYATIPILNANSLSDITNANFLLLQNDNIEEIQPGAFRNMKLKEALSLENNQLMEIRREVFNDVQVPVLILSYNQISYIDYQAFDNMTHLETIYLDHNRIQAINNFWFRQTPNLKNLHLAYNQIERVSENAFPDLRKIDLSHNLIRSIDRHAFSKIKKLQILNLAFNRLAVLDKNWLKGIKVNVLDISHNYLRCLEYGLAEPYGVNMIDGNPWECGCLKDMKKQEMLRFGKLEARESFNRCGISFI